MALAEPVRLVGAVTRDERAPALNRRLDSLAPGERAVLGRPTRIDGTVVRLLELGLTAGAQVSLTRRAPGGDPLEVTLRGTRVCLRRADAAAFPIATLSGGRADGR